MFRLKDRVRIHNGMMMDLGATAEVVGYAVYRVRVLNRSENVFREYREEDLELEAPQRHDSWPPVLDDIE